MNEIQILKAIIPELLNLENKNNKVIENILDRNHRSLIMIVERKFGRERDYINQLETLQKTHIRPLAAILGMSQQDFYKQVRKDLIKKRDGYLNLIETILDELKIEKLFYSFPKKIRKFKGLFMSNKWFSNEIGVTFRKTN